MVNDVTDEHPWKQWIPMEVTEFGMVSDVNDEHP
jgi:hypothetical protein